MPRTRKDPAPGGRERHGERRRRGILSAAADVATAEGDERFRALRIRLLNGVFLALRELASRAQADGRLGPGLDPGAAAGVLTTMLAHVSAHRVGFETWGVRRDALAETMATLIDWTVRSHEG